jgi:hypothetical protein
MEKGTWTLIMPSVPATSLSGYRWAGGAWEEIWDSAERCFLKIDAWQVNF